MGNQQGKLHQQQQSGRPKKMVHWKSAERPFAPGRPILIALSDQQPDVVHLRWDRPKQDGGSAVTGYVVEHRRMGSPHWVRATPTPVTQCEVSFSGLEPGWRYQFRVFAENVVGRSDPSELSDPLTVTLQRNAITVPRFDDELQDVQAVENERIEFRVRVLGQPPPEINWFKDGYEIFSSRRTKIVNDNDVSVLIIHQLALSDEGEIKCTATNRAGHVVTKAHLMVTAPPKIRLPRTYEDGLIIEAEEVLRLKVGIAGQPPPSVTWLHDGETITNGGRIEITNSDQNSMLKIDSVHRSDRGEYSVKATNNLGEDFTSFLVTVTARPNPPGKVKLNMSFGKSATLSWTAPIDDGGCKVGNYIVEYFRLGWNVWLKATTTRTLTTTLNDLIEGSEYKFRVKAENPYGVSDPSAESDTLFIPDPKRGINKPKSEIKLVENENKATQPVPPRRKTLSPSRPQQDAATETVKLTPSRTTLKPKPEVLDSAELHREMSYGTPDQVLKLEPRRSPSANNANEDTTNPMHKLQLKIELSGTAPISKSPQRSPTNTDQKASPLHFLQQVLPKKDKTPSPQLQKAPLPLPIPTATTKPETPKTSTLTHKRSLSPKKNGLARKPSPLTRRSPSPTEDISGTPALQRSAEPVQLGVSQQVRRYSNHGLSPLKNVPALAIAIATGGFGAAPTTTTTGTNGKPEAQNSKSVQKDQSKNNNSNKQNAATLTNPTIQISRPPPPLPPTPTTPPPDVKPVTSTTPDTTPLSTPPITTDAISKAATMPKQVPKTTDKHDEVHTSNEFMLVVFDKHSKMSDNDKKDSFELDLEDAIQAPPVSISSPDLASLEFTNLHTFPLRRSVSSTELLYERAMARFYEAVEIEEAEKARKIKQSEDRELKDKLPTTPTSIQPTTIRKRLGSMTEAERLSFERRSEMRRQSADIVRQDFRSTTPIKWGSRDNLSNIKPLMRSPATTLAQAQQPSQESEEFSEDAIEEKRDGPQKMDSFELGSDYTESTAPSEDDSIEKFKMELLARTRSPSPRDLETYHPRDMSAGVFTPYRAPTPEQATVVLTRPVPLPSPDFVPKPILKRSSKENILPTESKQNGLSNSKNNVTETTNTNTNGPNGGNEKLDIAKGIKSFFKRDKRSITEKNTAENQLNSYLGDQSSAATKSAEADAKRRTKEEEERKRQEAERIMQEEARAAADHYGDLMQQVSSHKYHTPIYLNREELKKAAGENTDDDEYAKGDNLSEQLRMQRAANTDAGLMLPISNKPRLSISERGQMIHVRETASNLAFTAARNMQILGDTPSEDSSASQFNAPTEQSADMNLNTANTSSATVISETTTVERPDSRGRTRIVKVKRIIRKRVPSGTRSRDTSSSRPPSSIRNTATQDLNTSQAAPVTRRTVSRTRNATAESKSPGPLSRAPMPPALALVESVDVDVAVLVANGRDKDLQEHFKGPAEQLTDEEAHEKVRSALSCSTDMVLFVVACYVYLFKDARLVLPILALMIYRQLGEVLSGYIPKWLKRKKND